MAVGEWMFIGAVRLDAIAMNREGWMDGCEGFVAVPSVHLQMEGERRI